MSWWAVLLCDLAALVDEGTWHNHDVEVVCLSVTDYWISWNDGWRPARYI